MVDPAMNSSPDFEEFLERKDDFVPAGFRFSFFVVVSDEDDPSVESDRWG